MARGARRARRADPGGPRPGRRAHHPAPVRYRAPPGSATGCARARELGVTPNAVLSAAWALVLSATVGRADIVFGATVAGRPHDVPGSDTAIGMFLNTVPQRVALDPAETAGDLLRRLHGERVALMDHEYLGLAELQREGGHPTLFDTLYVLQNFADDRALTELTERHGITGIGSVDATHYPMTLIVAPGDVVRVKLEYRPDLVSDGPPVPRWTGSPPWWTG
ncbi:condensation domain-containing protein [Streptomyces zhihengii]